MELVIALKSINVAQLDAEIREVIQDRFHGISTDQEHVRFIVDDDLSDEDQKTIEALYEAHMPTETDAEAVERKRGEKRDLRQVLREFDGAKVRTVADLVPTIEALISLAVDD